MENNHKEQQSGQQQRDITQEQNPTLQQSGTAVPDYGNVTGGSGSESPAREQGAESSRQGDSGMPMGEEDTLGNP